MNQVGLTFDFEKADNSGGYVRGWASVTSVDGEVFSDHSRDAIDIEEIRKAAHEFISSVRVAKAMHKGEKIGDIVESVIVDDDFAKALGARSVKRGWWIGMKVTSESIKKRVRSGELKAFSIGGRGVRVPISKSHEQAEIEKRMARLSRAILKAA